MDTITHGIAGALIGKAVFRGEDLFASHPMNRRRIITWSLMLGAIFPDSDGRRDIGMWLVFLPAPFLIAKIGERAGAPISGRVVLSAILIFAALFLLPALLGWGVKIGHDKWNRAGFAAALMYIACAAYAHHVALSRIQKFAELYPLRTESIGALPLPPSLWHWDGLVRTERGVYELRMDLDDKPASDGGLLTLEHHYFPDAPPNSYIEVAKRLPEVQKVLWFSRFPVTRFHKEGDVAVVEIADIRFVQVRRDRPAAFTYRVRLGSAGNLLSQGWATK